MVDTHSPSLYEHFKAAGCEVDHHESDLYVKVTDRATEIIRRHCIFKENVTTFRDSNGVLWFDLPFQFEPFWDKVRDREVKSAEVAHG